MAKILDLRKKVEPQVKVIYRTITTRQPWYVELSKVLAVIAIVTTVVWGITKADVPVSAKSWSAIGLVATTTDTTISIDNARSSENASTTEYSFDISSISKVETNKYEPLILSDLKTGDKVIIQGTIENDTMIARRVIAFISSTTATTTTATSTETLATTTVSTDIATSTASTTTEVATSTPDVSTSTDSIATTTDTTTDDPTSTTTDPVATTTPEVVTESTATTTEDVTPPATTPETTSDTSSTTENNI